MFWYLRAWQNWLSSAALRPKIGVCVDQVKNIVLYIYPFWDLTTHPYLHLNLGLAYRGCGVNSNENLLSVNNLFSALLWRAHCQKSLKLKNEFCLNIFNTKNYCHFWKEEQFLMYIQIFYTWLVYCVYVRFSTYIHITVRKHILSTFIA